MATLTPNRDTETTIVEQGTLKFEAVAISVTANGTFDIVSTVPTGKKRTLKYISVGQNGGTFTISQILTFIRNVGATISVTIDNVGASSTIISSGDKNITLEAGQNIRIASVITGWSVTGDVLASLVYQEFDA